MRRASSLASRPVLLATAGAYRRRLTQPAHLRRDATTVTASLYRTHAGPPTPMTIASVASLAKPSPGRRYATATVLHCESVLRVSTTCLWMPVAGRWSTRSRWRAVVVVRTRTTTRRNRSWADAPAGTGPGSSPAHRGRFLTTLTICSPAWGAAGTVPWSRSGSRPGDGLGAAGRYGR